MNGAFQLSSIMMAASEPNHPIPCDKGEAGAVIRGKKERDLIVIDLIQDVIFWIPYARIVGPSVRASIDLCSLIEETLISKLGLGFGSICVISAVVTGQSFVNRLPLSVLLALGTKNKVGFVDGTCVKNATDDVLSKQWDRCNSVVLSWLLGSISDELYAGLIFSENASTVWSEWKETYDKIDGSIIFNLHYNISTLKQGSSSLSEYYHKLNSLWKQYDAMANLKNCTSEAADQTVKHNNMLKLMQFLMGLNDCYMNVKSNLLLRDPLPDVKTAYSVLSREESHRGLTNSENKPQTSVFLAQTNSQTNSHIISSNNAVSDSNVQKKGNQTIFSNGNNSNNFSNNNRAALNPNYKCTKCHKIGHTIDRCYKIVGFPPGWKEKPFNKFHKNSDNHSSLNEDTGSGSGNNMNLTNEQMMKLLSLINEKFGP
ncbi:uncharacterized protein [Rutidosis leptorrhynchoides]|uniref:uncharacterized protein n=1 Tax=Rutidosis leptorrhynchoides TaxID=125765 RepID=UPI003A9A0C2B